MAVAEPIASELVRILPDLRRWARKCSGPHYDADDLVSDVVIRFLEKGTAFDGSRGPLKNYLFSCIRNMSWDSLKSYNRKGRREFRKYLRTEAALYVIDSRPETELRSTVERCFEKMSKRLAEPFRMFALEGKSYREISVLLGVRIELVRSLIHRARAKMRCLVDVA